MPAYSMRSWAAVKGAVNVPPIIFAERTSTGTATCWPRTSTALIPSACHVRGRRELRGDRRELHGHALDAVDEVRPEAVDGAVELHVRQPAHELGEHHAHPGPGRVGAAGEVRPTTAEGHVHERGVRASLDVEREGVVEDRLVTVGRDVPHHDA